MACLAAAEAQLRWVRSDAAPQGPVGGGNRRALHPRVVPPAPRCVQRAVRRQRHLALPRLPAVRGLVSGSPGADRLCDGLPQRGRPVVLGTVGRPLRPASRHRDVGLPADLARPDDPPAPGDLPVDLRRPQRLRQPRLRRDGIGQPRRLGALGRPTGRRLRLLVRGRLHRPARVVPGAGRRHPHGARRRGRRLVRRAGPALGLRRPEGLVGREAPTGSGSGPGGPARDLVRRGLWSRGRGDARGLPRPRGCVGTRRARRGRRPVDPPFPYRRVDLGAHRGGARRGLRAGRGRASPPRGPG